MARFALLLPPGLPARRLLAAPWQGVAPPDPRRVAPSRRRRGGTLCLMSNKLRRAVLRAFERFFNEGGGSGAGGRVRLSTGRVAGGGQRQSRPRAERWGRDSAPMPAEGRPRSSNHPRDRVIRANDFLKNGRNLASMRVCGRFLTLSAVSNLTLRSVKFDTAISR